MTCRLLDHGFIMRFRNIPNCIIFLLLVNIGKNEGLLLQGSSINSNNTIHGYLGQNVDMAGIMQMLTNLTAELENLKQQTAEIEHLKQKTEKDQLTIQLLQNRVFSLETEQNNLSKLPSVQEFSTYLSGMNQLTHSLVSNEANDRNLSRQLNKALGDLKQNIITTTQELRNQSMDMERLKQQSQEDRSTIQQLNGSLTQEICTIKEHIASMYANSIRLSTNVTITSGYICFNESKSKTSYPR